MGKGIENMDKGTLTAIREMAGLFFTPDQICTALEIDANSFGDELHYEDSEVYKAFHGGRIQSEIELRKSVLKMARAGSSPAQAMAVSFLEKSKLGSL